MDNKTNDDVTVINSSMQKRKDDYCSAYESTLCSVAEREVIEKEIQIINLSSYATLEIELSVETTSENGSTKVKLNGVIDATKNNDEGAVISSEEFIITVED